MPFRPLAELVFEVVLMDPMMRPSAGAWYPKSLGYQVRLGGRPVVSGRTGARSRYLI